MKLLCFDDQISNIECFQSLLQNDFDVIGTTDTVSYCVLLKEHKPLAIMLDLHMPICDGLVLYDKIIKSEDYNKCPIFFISGDVSDEARLITIQTGGIDFFSRVIKEKELKLRLFNKIKLFLQGDLIIDIGNLRLDTHLFNVYVNSQLAELTLHEFRILSYVLRKLPNNTPRNELMEQVWGSVPRPGTMNVHISNLRAKLCDWNHELNIIKDDVGLVRKR
jgi:two-component system OmpR family response regulator